MSFFQNRINPVYFIAACMAAMFFIATQGMAVGKNKLVIRFEHYVGDHLLKLDSANYRNALGQSYTVSKFKYYIGNFHLKRKDGTEFVSSEYFLVDEDEPGSKQISLQAVPEGDYVSIGFMIGVDSLHNCSGAQSGALDPVNGMFWAWNTGYVFLKMEGHSPASKSPGNILEFHIGGYREPNNCIRTVLLPVRDGVLKTGVRKNTVIAIKADLAEIFMSPVAVDFSKLSSVTDFHNATTIADNYRDLFSLKEVK